MDKVKKLFLGNLNLVLAIVGVVILLITYVAGYQNLSTLNTEMETTLNERTEYLTKLKEYYGNISKYRASVSDSKENISKNLSRLPCGIKDEDFLLYLMELNKETGAKLSSVSFESAESVAEFETIINEKMTAVTGYRTGTTSSSTMNYEQFKKYLAYVYDEKKPITYIDSVTVTASGEDSSLNTVFNISKYYINYEGAEYEGVKAPDVALGKTNIFGAK